MPEQDARFMARAIELAAHGAGMVAPNPLVGAVVVRDGAIVGEGWHAQFGGPHAEVMALEAAGSAAHGATVYVTLEPCRHQGKTPPCTEALLAAGVTRVVYAVPDPNPVAAGGGVVLQAAGVAVTTGVDEQAARDLNAPFLFAATHPDRPFVTLKLALSIDGALVDASRQRGWLTGPGARRAVHVLRRTVDAVAVGIGTALADDPALTVRDVPAPRVAPRRVVFDRTARLPQTSALVRSAHETPVLVVCAARAGDPDEAARRSALEGAGVTLIPADTLPEALAALRAQGVQQLLVEGGATLASAFMGGGLVDRLITFQAPVILGAGALPAFVNLPPQAAATAPRLRVIRREPLGADLMTTYAVSGD
ncbi:MAG: bifunctional diaminohydroxyphosphoribosylaminopyrimidine deaminase/5-amino-6-(5-phosphoribosylamino)uracil reductase RibD [Gemmatimonadaceae bacterium]